MAELDRKTLAGWLQELLAECNTPGASAAVWHGGRLIEAAAGVAHLGTRAGVATDTVFQIGSTSKIFTTTMVMQLVDEGLVDLDAPIVDYLPELRLADEQATRTITTRHLLTHTSGLEGDLFTDIGEDDECVARLVALCADVGQLHPPGERFSYCNTGFVILGRLAEVLRQSSHETLLRERVCDPAGLDIVTTADAAIMRRSAVGHVTGPDGLVVAPRWALPRSMAPAGSVICADARTVVDFGLAHRKAAAGDLPEFLGAASARAMGELQVKLPDTATLPAYGWGLGWILFDWEGLAVVGHDGGTIGQGSSLRVADDGDLVVAVLHNGGQGGRLTDGVVRRVFEQVAGVKAPAKPEPNAAVQIDPARYVGRYSRLYVDLDIDLVDDGLQLTSRPYGELAAWSPAMTVPLVPASEDVLLAVTAPGAYLPLTFLEPDADGRPTWVHTGMRAQRRQR